MPVLAIMLFLMVTFLAVLTYSLSRYSQHIKARNNQSAELLSEAGIQRFLVTVMSDSLLRKLDPVIAPNGGSFEVQSYPWGANLLVSSIGRQANQKVTTFAILGTSPSSLFDAAITVCDERYPLMVAGHSSIRGDVRTGPQGMASGRIQGEDITSENFHTGTVRQHQQLEPPHVDTVLLQSFYTDMARARQQVDRFMHGSQIWKSGERLPFQVGGVVQIDGDLEIDGLAIDHLDAVTTLIVQGGVTIKGSTRILGPLRICSDGPILICDTAFVDAFLFTPGSILLKGQATLAGTALSNRRISITEKSNLQFPALLQVHLNDSTETDTCGIWIGGKGTLEGTCFLSSNGFLQTLNVKIYLDTGSVFTGAIMSDGYSELRGRLNGAIITEDFLYEQPLSTYINWLKDCRIDRRQLDYPPALPVLDRSYGSRLRLIRQMVAQ